MKRNEIIRIGFVLVIGMLTLNTYVSAQTKKRASIDYRNPNIGGIGHLLVATDPVVQLSQGTIRLALFKIHGAKAN